MLWFSDDFRAHLSRRVKETLARNGVKGAGAFGCIFTVNYAVMYFLITLC